MRNLEIDSEQRTLSPSASFWGERLQLVREFRSMTQKEMGFQLGVSHAVVSDYEKGKRFPSREMLVKISDQTGFLPEFFLNRLNDPFTETQCSFRHRRNTPERLKSQVRAHATLLGIIVSSLKIMLRFPALNVPAIPAGTQEEIESAAESVRKFWNLDLNSPILQVGRVIERAGVVIIPSAVDTTRIDAFSRYGANSLIFLNRGTGSRPSRWNFDLAHEFGHLVMHRNMPTGSIETERAADSFASAFLLPRTAFSREFRTRQFSWSLVFDLKQRWHVSAAAIIRRGRDLGLLDDISYRRAFQYMSFKKWRIEGEPFEPVFQEPELFTTALDYLGKGVKKTLQDLCRELCFTPEVFTQITGMPVVTNAVISKAVLEFPSVRDL